MELLNSALEKLSYNIKVKNLKRNFDVIHYGYTNNAGKGDKYIDTYEDALCYAFFRMASTTAVIKKCLSYIPKSEEAFSLLDLGAGTGASVFACVEQENINFARLNCIESSESMLKVFKSLVAELSTNFDLEFVKKDVIKDNLEMYNSDIVLASFSMNEMSKSDRVNLLNKMWKLSNKYILIIEPGTPKAHKEMMEYKEYLITLGGKVVAPCMIEKCPIIENKTDDWCHFQVRLQRPVIESKIKDSNRNFEDEKFTFLLFSKDANGEGRLNKEGIIIRRPTLQKGRITLSLCTKNGTIEHKIFTKKDGEVYKKAKKLEVGDYV